MNVKTNQQDHLQSHFLNETIPFIIHYPPNYEPTRKYRYLIAQDAQDFMQFGRLFKTIDRNINDNKLQEFIVILLPYESVKIRAQRCHPNGSEFLLYQRFIAEELVPYLDLKLPSFQDAKSRFLAGVSLGATLSIALCLRYPSTFGKVCLFSPFLDEDMLEKCRTQTPVTLVVSHVYGTQEHHVDTTFGNPDCDFTTPNQHLEQIWCENLYYSSWTFEGGHTWKNWQQELSASLQVFNEKEF